MHKSQRSHQNGFARLKQVERKISRAQRRERVRSVFRTIFRRKAFLGILRRKV